MLPWLCYLFLLPELISCPGCKRVYPTRDVTEHFFLQCFSPEQFKMARVSQDPGSSWSLSETCGTPIHKSIYSSLLPTSYPAISLPNHPSIHLPIRPSVLLCIYPEKKWKCLSWGKQNGSFFPHLTVLTEKYSYWAFIFSFLPLSWNSCNRLC